MRTGLYRIHGGCGNVSGGFSAYEILLPAQTKVSAVGAMVRV